MKEVSFRLGVVTPLFLAGAVQRAAEPRPPSIRGVLRFWFRAFAGPVLSYDVSAVQRAETKLFGSTEQASYWSLRMSSFDKDPLPESTFLRTVAYLGYGPIIGNRSQRAFYPPGSSCRLTIKWLRTDLCLAELLEATLWIWGQLGGLGARTRRGFGGITLRPETGTCLPLWSKDAADPKELAQNLEEGLDKCHEIFRQVLSNILIAKEHKKPSFFVLDSLFAELYVGDKVFQNQDEALNTVGSALMDFRQRHKLPDRDIVYQFLTSSSKPLLKGTTERAQFGLPLNFYFRQLGVRASVTAIKGKNQQFDRRASPLVIRIMPLKGGSCCVALLYSKAEFLPAGAELLLQAKGTKTLSLPQGNLIEDFLKELFQDHRSEICEMLGKGIRIALPTPVGKQGDEN